MTSSTASDAAAEQASLPGSGPDAAHFADVLAAEIDYIRHHRHPHMSRDEVARSLVGIALSGGGIRSATTNLGILQRLAALDILPLVDYVSTVSGGGYIGACLSSLLSWNRQGGKGTGGNSRERAAAYTFTTGQQPHFGTEYARFPFRTAPIDGDVPPGRDQVAHLRTHGQFLIARKGFLRRETMRSVGTILTGVVYNVTLVLLTLFTVAALYLAAVLMLTPNAPRLLTHDRLATPAAVASSGGALVDVDSAVARVRQDSCVPHTPGCVVETRTSLRPLSLRQRIGANIGAMVAALRPAPAYVPAPELGAPPAVREASPWWPLLAALLVGVLITIAAFAVITSAVRRLTRGGGTPPPRSGESEEDVFERAVLLRVASTAMALTAVAVLVLRFVWPRNLPGHTELAWLLVPFAVFFGARITTFFSTAALLPRAAAWSRRLRSLWGSFVAMTIYGWWITLLFALLPLIVYAVRDHKPGLAVGAIVSLLATRFLAPSSPGGKSRFSIPPGLLRFVMAIAVGLLVLLTVLFFAAVLAGSFITPWPPLVVGVLLALLLTAAGLFVDHNKLGIHYFYRDRLAETYLYTEAPNAKGELHPFRDAMEMPLRFLNGVPAPGSESWRNTAPYHIVSAAINLAGSRDLTRKDRKSGYFIFSKLFCGSTHTGFRPTHLYRTGETKLARAITISGAAASSAIGRFTFFAQAFATVLFNLRLGFWMENPAHEGSLRGKEEGIFWPDYLRREVMLATNEHDRLVNLSDGGHTGDNVGIYPLLQRRCKIIIACDCEKDPAMAFGSFTEALRHAYVDEGIDVDINLSMLRPDPVTGLSRSHCAVGRVRYPDRPDQMSWIIFLKNSLTGDEPEPVLNYRADCSDFPHESTADQFFDDAQFESYRALGDHIARFAFGGWRSSGEPFESVWRHHSPAPVSGGTVVP